MSRAERRRLEKEAKKKKKTYTMTESAIVEIKKQATRDAVEICINLMFGIPLLAFRDLSKWGKANDWGKKRLNKMYEHMEKIYKDFENGLITLDDINQVLNDEVGLEVSNKSSGASKEIYGGSND